VTSRRSRPAAFAGLVLASLVLAACATPRAQPPAAPFPLPPAPAPVPAPSPQPLRRLSLSELPGWISEDYAAAFAAYRDNCQAARDPALAEVCRRAKSAGPLGPQAARDFLQANFVAEPEPGQGVLTGYFAPVYAARRTPQGEFTAPLRPKPADLQVVGGAAFQLQPDHTLVPYPARKSIEASPAVEALAWLRPEELFFLQVQGSGVLVFEDGRRLKALYAANNGQPFAGIANPMRDRGLLPRDQTSAEAIRAWLAAHRGPEADALMQLNPRYAFFRLAPDDGQPPVGAANLPLPPGRAVAVDPAFHTMGELLWLDAEAPILAGAFPRYRRLVTALDTGGAIKGEVRADLYIGQGDAAGTEAGRVRHALRLYRLVPR